MSWSGVEHPSQRDVVALAVPAGANATVTPPVKHKWCSDAHTHLSDGEGALKCARHRSPAPASLLTHKQLPAALSDLLYQRLLYSGHPSSST